MNRYVADTIAIVLYLEKRKLPQKIKDCFTEAENKDAEILIPIIAITEIAYLYEHKRIDINIDDIKNLVSHNKNFIIENLDLSIIECSFEIKDIKELHDRLIAGTARRFTLKLLTNDSAIEKSKFVETIWK